MSLRCAFGSVLIATILLSFGCAQKPTASGPPGQWIKGKKLAINVSFGDVSVGGQKFQVRNDSDQNAIIAPFTIIAWFKEAGKKENTLSKENFKREIMPPGNYATLPIIGFVNASPGDELYKLQLEFGSGSDKEIFLVQR